MLPKFQGLLELGGGGGEGYILMIWFC